LSFMMASSEMTFSFVKHCQRVVDHRLCNSGIEATTA
jgi:hypothetical protein